MSIISRVSGIDQTWTRQCLGSILSKQSCSRRQSQLQLNYYVAIPSVRPRIYINTRGLCRQLNTNGTAKSDAAQTRPRKTASGIGIARSIYGAGFLVVTGILYLYITDTRAGVHQYVVPPVLRALLPDAENAHHAGVSTLQMLYKFGLHPRERSNEDQELGDLKIEIFGHVLDNPVGTSAGIDKDAEIPSALLALGPAVVEVGGVTPRPQEGNPQPRVFRIASQNALINRYGLNSEGADHVAMILRQRVRDYAYQAGLGITPESEQMVLDGKAGVPPGSLTSGKIMLVQVAKNKATPDNDIVAIAQDYVYGVDRLAKYADVVVVNVSSPNTPGLRDLQAVAPLTAILTAVVDTAKSVHRATKPAVMVKVSPDEDSDAQIEGICTAVWNSGVDGVIVGNTTKKRPGPIPQGFIIPANDEKTLTEVGGYSGPQMFHRTLDLVKRYRAKLDQGSLDSSNPSDLSGGKESVTAITVQAPAESTSTKGEAFEDSNQPSANVVTSVEGQTEPMLASAEPKVIFATGGITNGEQCLQILNAGASVCQIYTAMMYGGIGTATRIKSEMREVMHGNRSESDRRATTSRQ